MRTRAIVSVLITATVCVAVLGLVAAAMYGIVLNSLDWHQNHVRGSANLASPLAALIGSLLSALIAGAVGYVTGKRRPVERQELGVVEPEPPAKHRTQPPPEDPKWLP